MSDHGYGAGGGHGHGQGYGHGYVHGYGYGYGDGDGYGYGHGDGDGDGDAAFGDVVDLPGIGGYTVSYNKIWGLIEVGCQIHTVDHWAKHWRKIAEENDVDVTEDEVDEIINEIRRLK